MEDGFLTRPSYIFIITSWNIEWVITASSRVHFMLIWWFLGNCIQCERVGHHFLINTDILRNIWPTDLSLPYKLAIESIFHGFLLISFQACFWMPSATTSPLLPVPSPFSSTRSINNAIPALSLGNSSIPIANCTHFVVLSYFKDFSLTNTRFKWSRILMKKWTSSPYISNIKRYFLKTFLDF